MSIGGELGALRRRITQVAGGPEPHSVAQLLRYLLTTPDPTGLPAFMPYWDDEGNEVWAESGSLSDAQWRRVRAYALCRVREALEAGVD